MGVTGARSLRESDPARSERHSLPVTSPFPVERKAERFQIIGAIELRKQIDNEWMLILGGALSVLFGIALFVAPGAGALALVWLIGSYAILFGILNIAFAMRLRRHA